MDQARRIYLIRHGETTHNSDRNRFSGITDVQLTATGIRQCKALRSLPLLQEVEVVYSSPLQRSVDSARLVFPDREPVIFPPLTEFDYGIYEGAAVELTPAGDPIIQQWQTHPGDLTFPGGGNIREHASLAFAGLQELAAGSDATVIACVSHKTTIRLLAALVLKLDLDHFRRIPCANCSVTELHLTPAGGFLLAALNVTAQYFHHPNG